MVVIEKRPRFQAEQWHGLASGLITGVQCDGDPADEAAYFVNTADGQKRVVKGDFVVYRDGAYQVLTEQKFRDQYEEVPGMDTEALLAPLTSKPA